MNNIKERILDIAKERFDRFGYKKTTLDEICRDGKFSKKTVYEHFIDKEDLFSALFIRETLAARKVIFERLGDIPDPLERLKELARISLCYFKDDSFLTRVLKDQDSLFMPFMKVEYTSFVENGITGIIAGIIKEGIDQGRFRKVDENLYGYMFFKLFQSFSYARTCPPTTTREDDEKETGVLFDLLQHTLAKD